MTITKKLKNVGTALGLVGILALNEGCSTTPETYNFGRFLGYQTAAAAIEGSLNPQGTNVVINNQAPNYVPQQDYIILKDYCKINGKNFVEGNITKIYEDNLWILSGGISYNIQFKDVEKVIDN